MCNPSLSDLYGLNFLVILIYTDVKFLESVLRTVGRYQFDFGHRHWHGGGIFSGKLGQNKLLLTSRR